jgi:hypothetical protein
MNSLIYLSIFIHSINFHIRIKLINYEFSKNLFFLEKLNIYKDIKQKINNLKRLKYIKEGER